MGNEQPRISNQIDVNDLLSKLVAKGIIQGGGGNPPENKETLPAGQGTSAEQEVAVPNATNQTVGKPQEQRSATPKVRRITHDFSAHSYWYLTRQLHVS